MKCRYCKLPTKGISLYHKECKLRHSEGLVKFEQMIMSTINDFEYCRKEDELTKKYVDLIDSFHISKKETCAIINNCINTLSEKRPYSISILYCAHLINVLSRKNGINPNHDTLSVCASECAKKLLEDSFGKKDQNAAKEILTYLKALTSDEVYQNTTKKAIETEINLLLEDHVITNDEEEYLKEIMDICGLKTSDFSNSNEMTKCAQSIILRKIKNNEDFSDTIQINGLPILLGKTEKPVWLYNGIFAYEEKTGKRYEGHSQGVSIRIAKGVYYRVGASKGYPVDYTYTSEIGRGALIVTTKNIIFYSPGRTIKSPINKIISITPYENGLTIQRDGRTRPIMLSGLDPWFIQNLISLLYD